MLGDTLAAIAGEKAGILKSGCPAVTAVQPPEALTVIQDRAMTVGAPLHKVDITKLSLLSRFPAGQRFSYDGMEDVFLPLLGRHQAENACAAIEAGRALGLDDDAIRAGLRAAQWPCRFELMATDPPFVLDGAHNGHGAAALAAGLKEYFPAQRFTMVMGVMADKPWREMLALMEPLAARFICIAPEGPRALPAADLAAAIQTVPAETADTLPEALAKCRAHGGPVCAFGSLYYIGQLRELLKEETS